ncbi:MAG: DUF502 domain-containing protein [Endomicrobiaceae bacterium]|jgi:uncharacterized membrane protein|nr:DUF502 domain-containing protein [Endomicrobiaceae bacterium]
MENNELQKTTKSEMKNIKDFFKRYFIAGLLILLPLWLTIVVFMIVFDWTSNVSMSYTLPILKYFMRDKAWVYFSAKILSFFLTIIIICFVGFFATNLAGKKILKFFEDILLKVPAMGGLYAAFKKFISFFSGNNLGKDFQKVIFIPFPTKTSYCVAFSTGKRVINNQKYVTVFMPTTPNPTTGFLILVKEEDVIESDYTIEEGIQYIISAGIITPDNKIGLKNINNKAEE